MRPIERIDYDHGNKILVLKPHLFLESSHVKAFSETAVMHRWPCGNAVDYGVVGRKKITYAFIVLLTGALKNDGSQATLTNFKFHGVGTGTTPEATAGAGSTLVTSAMVDITGSTDLVEGTQVQLNTASTQSVYRSVGVIPCSDTGTNICEHVLTNSASAGAGVTMDRTLWTGGDVFSVVSGSTITVTYTSTWLAGG